MKLPLVFPALLCAFVSVHAAPVAVNDSFTTPEDIAAGSAAVNLINTGFEPANSTFVLPAQWSYNDAMKTVAAGGTNQYPVDAGTNTWKSLAFDTATSNIGPWKTAPMPIQGGGVDGLPGAANLLTGITGGNQTNTVNSYLFRNKFTITPAQAGVAPEWAIGVLADDGCIIYLNGEEIGRVNYPNNVAVEPDALVGGQGGSETAYSVIFFSPSKFVDGENILSVELHQNSNNSSDAGIDFQMAPSPLEGFTPVDDAFFATARPDNSAQAYTPTGGFNGTGALRLQMGNVFAFGGGASAVSGAWRKTFTLAAPATVTLSFRHRMISAQDYDAGEYQEVICDLDGTQLGAATAPSTHLAVDFQVGDGNGGGAKDTGWKQRTFEIPLAAGNHTLSLGGYGNIGTGGGGGTNESFEVLFDDIVLAVPGTVSLLANDTGGIAPVTAVKASDPAHGAVTVNADGSFNYVPQSNWFGVDSFTYRAVDGSGQSPPATVTITVESVNDVPVAGNDGPFDTPQNTAVTIGAAQSVLLNDSDVETPALTAVIGPASSSGTTTLNPDGTFTFTPNTGFAGVATFTYRASDGTAQSAPATVSINVLDSPDSPTAIPDTYTAIKNTPLVVSATTPGNTTDEVLPYQSEGWHYFDSMDLAKRDLGTTWRTDAYTETADWKVGPAELGYGDDDEGTQIADNPDPAFDQQAGDKFATAYFRRMVDITDYHNVLGYEVSVIYDDALAFYFNGNKTGRTNNLPDVATMAELGWDYYPQTNVQDNSTQTFNLPPSALNNGANLIAAEVHQNAPTSSDISFDLRLRVIRATAAGVLANDNDPDAGQKDTLVAEVVAQPTHGTLAISANGTFTYTPANNYTGPDSFTYRAKDTTDRMSEVTTASITVVTGPNVPPIANPDTYAATEDTSLDVKAGSGVLINDTDAEGDIFTAVIATQASHGTVTLNPNGGFLYQPAANYNGADSFTYRAADARPSPPATVTINVAPVNDVPLATNDTYSGDPGQPLSIPAAQGVLSNDSDVDAGTVLTAELVGAPVTGTSLNLNADGSFTFSAPAGGVYSFTYRAKDATSQSGTATVTISLNAVPVTLADNYPTVEDSAVHATAAQGVLANDTDAESQPLTAQLVSNVQHGTLTLNPNGSFDYSPAANFNGSDSFTYRAFDGTRLSPVTTATFNITPVNDAPQAVADTYGVRIDTAFSVNAANGVLRNDTDVDNPNITAAVVSQPADGTLTFNPDGSFTFTPEPGFSGARTFTYRASDGTAQSAVTTVTLNVTADLNTVSISEIMYNPPGVSGVSEEFIEIYNYGDAAVDLTGWRFSKGVNFSFPDSTLIGAKSYLAVPADHAAFLVKYLGVANVTTSGWGPISSLSNSGETLQLENRVGETVSEVQYSDEGDWAVRKIVGVWDATNTPGAAPPPVGNLDTDPGLEWVTAADPNPEIGNMGGSSIQLRNQGLSNDSGQNWAAATPTPGAANASVALTNSPPLIRGIKHNPPVPDQTQQVFVTAEIQDELTSGVTASVFYRTWQPSAATPDTETFTEVAMADNGQRGDGTAGDGRFGAVIPAQPLNTVVEFYVQAADAGSNTRTWPAPTLDLDGANPVQNANCLYQVNEEVWTDHRPLYQMVLTGADNATFNGGTGNRQSNAAPNCTVILRRGNDFAIRYLGSIRTRGNSSRNDTPVSLRMDIPRDDPWDGRTAFTLNVKYTYSQFLASRMYEAAGTPVEKAGIVGARINGANRIIENSTNTRVRSFGFYCDLIPRGGDTVKEWFPDNDDGNAYGKIRAGFGGARWQVSTLPTIGAGGYAVGGYVNEGYWKQNNAAQNDWTDLHAWMQSLNAGNNENFDTTIRSTVDIDQWCRFLAVSTIINHGETNMANGDDDDYSVYFGAVDKLCRLIPHDLDTCFNLNAIGLGDEVAPPTITIYQCTDPSYIDNATLPQMEKFYRNPVTGRKFKAALRLYLDTIFAKPRFDATVDQLLDSQWLGTQYTPNGDAIRAQIKSFLDARRTTIETFLPTAFTAATTLAVQNGLPRSTSATDLGGLGGKIDPARTAEVRVNGVKMTTNPYGSTGPTDNSWSAGTAVTLQPGLNNLVCSAHDEHGSVFASQTVTIWYDTPGTNKSGALAANETWTPSGGPYNVTANVSVPSGFTLTIEPGTTVFMAPGTDLTVGTGGRLLAQGTAEAGITITRNPAATGNWGGITVNGTSAESTILSYVTFENNGDTAFHSQNGANVELDHLTFRNTGEQYLSLDESSFIVSDCIFPASTAGFEPVHGTNGIAPGGIAIIRNCWFGKTQGYNDSIDFTGGNRPGSLLQVINCVFNGSDDDILDLDSTDAWVEGNIFMHAHRNGSPDSASAISGGTDNPDFSQITVIRNLFYDCDNAVTVKQGNNQPNGNSAVLLYNTIVHTTKTGGEDTASGVVNYDDDNATGEGKGIYLEGNIIWDAENLTRSYDPVLSQLTLVNNILPSAPPASATASGNIVTDPLLNLSLITNPGTATAEQVIAALKPRNCSPALGSGPLGRDKGAGSLEPGIAVQVPPSTHWPSSVALPVGPAGSFTPISQTAWTYGYTQYKYSLDGGPESQETPVTTPLTLNGLTSGPHTLSVWGRNDAGSWQENPTNVAFAVTPGAPTVAISEILADSTASADMIELYNWGTAPAVLGGCSVSDDPASPAKLLIGGGVSIPAGGRLVLDATQLGFNLSRGGETIGFYAPGGVLVDSVQFGPQITNLSIARIGSTWVLATPSPNAATTALCETGTGSTLRINEWIGANDFIVDDDFVELYNPDPNPANITGWSLSQDYRNDPRQNTFPPLSFVAGGGFLELAADGNTDAGADHLSFRISRVHDSIALLNPADAVVDQVAVLSGNPDVSQGRTTDGASAIGYLPLPTPGFSNSANVTAELEVMTGLRITELRFDPPSDQAEFIEFKNISAAPLTISGVSFGSGITFAFPAVTLAAGAYTVITNDLARFNAQFPGVTATQWNAGRLDNNGESVRIETATYGLGILDFRYEGNWYAETRAGASLEIVDAAAPRSSWNLRDSWQPAANSPGGPSAFGVIAPVDQIVATSSSAILHGYVFPGPQAPGSITVQWTKVSGPGNVVFTAPANKDTDASFSAVGTYELRLAATSPGGSASDTVVVNVAETYDAWAARTLSAFSAPQRARTADADLDGVANIVENVMGTDPAVRSAGPQLVIENNFNNRRLSLRYTISKLADPAIQVTPQVSDALGNWHEGAGYVDVVVESDSPAAQTRRSEDVSPLGASAKKFMRLKVVIP